MRSTRFCRTDCDTVHKGPTMISKEQKKALAITAIIGLGLFVVLCLWCGISPGFTGRVLDVDGNPIANVYVIYGYRGNYVEGQVDRPGTLIQTDRNGYFRIPPKVHTWLPPFARLYLEIYAVYDSKTHCAGALPSKRLNSTQLRYFEEGHWWFEIKEIDDIETLVFHDVSDDPAEWYSSIKQVQEALCIFSYGWEAPVEKKKELLNYILQEYENLAKKYGDQQCNLRFAKDFKVKTFNAVIAREVGGLEIGLERELRQEYENRIMELSKLRDLQSFRRQAEGK